ncbi:MAG: hypothetical protein ACI3ZN_03145 [Candidatus Cryptobacteroides sp.]
MKEFWTAGVQGYALAGKDIFEKVIEEVSNDYGTEINPTLLKSYTDNLIKGVRGVFGDIKYGDRHYDILNRLERNVGRFAAYKAYHATAQVKRALTSKGTKEQGVCRAIAVLKAFNRYQSAEYNTAVSRSRTAKQWIDYTEGPAADLFPNLRWLPSRSATPREQHIPYYNHVWAKTDAFWKTNQPGNLWNCKCDWEETSDNPDGGDVETSNPPASLEGNPGETGEAFTNKSVYFTASDHEKAGAAILEAGEKGYYTKPSIEGVTVRAHLLHEAGEIAGNMEVVSVFCGQNSGIKSVTLLPNVTKENESLRRGFYPEGLYPRGASENADAIIEWVSGEKWLVDFKCMQGNGGNLEKRLDDAYQQADYAIIKIKGDIRDLAVIQRQSESYLKRHRLLKGIFIYDKRDNLIFGQ